MCRGRGADGVYDQLLRHLQSRGDLYRQDLQGRQAGRFASRAGHEIRICDQPQDGKSARARRAAIAARARESADRMKTAASTLQWQKALWNCFVVPGWKPDELRRAQVLSEM